MLRMIKNVGLILMVSWLLLGIAQANKPATTEPEKREKILAINFAPNSADIAVDDRDEVEKVACYLKRNPQFMVRIEGHADSSGTGTYDNKILSQHRAEAVMNLLIDHYAIPAKRVMAIGRGAEDPIASNDNPVGREKNRRVVAVLMRLP